jgi:hypothetical protein
MIPLLRFSLKLMVISCLIAVGGVTGAWGQPSQPTLPPLTAEKTVSGDQLEIGEGKQWTQMVQLPELPADYLPILSVRAYVPAGGGCNFIMRVLINDRPLRENLFRPVLLNKLPYFTPPGTDYHFSWSRGSTTEVTANSWMTIFTPPANQNWSGTGQDSDYVFLLPNLPSDQQFKLSLEHTYVGLGKAMNRDQVPLMVEKVALGSLPAAAVEAARQQIHQSLELSSVPVQAALPADAGPGTRAYEVVWSGRPEPQVQVTFDDLNQWQVDKIGPGEVSLAASTEQRIWRSQTAELKISATDQPLLIRLTPREPIPITDPVDAANFFVYGHGHFMGSTFVPVMVQAEFTDAGGLDFEIDLGGVNMGYWVMLHGLTSVAAARLQYPLQFTGLQLSLKEAKGDYRLFLESLQVYQRNRQPLVYPRLQSPQFPLNNKGLLPTPPPEANTQVQAADGGVRFTSEARQGTLQLTVNPAAGCLDGITARWNDGPTFRPCASGGLVTEAGPVSGELVSQQLQQGALTARWRNAQGLIWEATYRLQGVSLTVDLQCHGGQAIGTAFGEVTDLPGVQGIEVPYLHFNRPGGQVACGNGIFLSVLPDIYLSDYSTVDATFGPGAADGLRLFTQTVYTPLTDGRRNDLRDRLVITVSPEFIDILPNHQNPPSPHRHKLAPYMFVMDRASNLQRWDSFKLYGLDHVIANDFAGIFVNDYSEGFGGRWRPHPDYTIEQVQGWRDHIQQLGYLFGLYIDVTDYYPLNEFWDENNVSLTTTGDLCDAWWGSYAPKTSFLQPFTEKVGRLTHQHYPGDCVYLDVSTNRGARAMDFEAGVPEAGMARAMITGIGDSLLEARQWYGTTISEGVYRWMYAGLSDMDYAQTIMKDQMPVPLDFDLLKLHPCHIGTMMGYAPSTCLTTDEIKTLGSGEKPGPLAFYKYVGTSLAYGHMALLGYGYFPPMQTIIQHYALMQGLQCEYLADDVVSIEYHNGERFVSTSEALLAGDHHRGRVRVRYREGLTVTVNLHPENEWTVIQDEAEYQLPPYGWVISKAPQILAYSALINGARVDYVQCPAYTYLNTGHQQWQAGPLEVQGAAWLKRHDDHWQIIPCGALGYWQKDLTIGQIPADRGCPVLIVDPARLAPQPLISGLGAEGQLVPVASEQLPDGRLQLQPAAEAVSIILKAR